MSKSALSQAKASSKALPVLWGEARFVWSVVNTAGIGCSNCEVATDMFKTTDQAFAAWNKRET